ncbi:MAG TPA: hypothetical protein P5277_04500 [Candidatus Paceibacterota bacterium]|nr:hypothetical protein [Candidatus Paceibacterota bacterium]
MTSLTEIVYKLKHTAIKSKVLLLEEKTNERAYNHMQPQVIEQIAMGEINKLVNQKNPEIRDKNKRNIEEALVYLDIKDKSRYLKCYKELSKILFH